MVNDRKFILVIDDSSTIRALVADILHKNGFETLEAETVELALMDLERKRFDMAVVDIFMPGMGGIEGIAKIKQDWPEIKIIAISAGTDGMDKEKTLKAASIQGADMTLSKPFEEEDLLAAVNGLLDEAEGQPEAAA